MNVMVKGSALYIVIVVAFIIGVICAALVSTAYFYRLQYQKINRYDRLENNLGSGINILLGTSDTSFQNGGILNTLNVDNDSVFIKKTTWGIYHVGIVKAFIQKDTLFRTFLFANSVDSGKWAALYLADHNLPLSISGESIVKGTAYLPKAGIRQAFVDNQAFNGDKNLITGIEKISEKILPPLDSIALENLMVLSSVKTRKDSIKGNDTIRQSFLSSFRLVDLGKKQAILKKFFADGNIIIHSDTAIYIDSSVSLNNVIISAKSISVANGFKGNCQLFASEFISVGKRCSFNYPSVLGIIGTQENNNGQIVIDSGTTFSGVIFTWEKSKSHTPPVIEIKKRIKVSGQIYSQGVVKYVDSSYLAGSLFADNVLYQKTLASYPGYLINARINSTLLSRYYLTSPILPVASKKRKVLKWLESN